jgi:hypothetical protein
MFEYLKRASHKLFDRLADDTSVPVFDGALKPNHLLDTAEVLFEHTGLADMAIDSQGHLIVAYGTHIAQVTLDGAVCEPVCELRQPINALCSFRDGLVAATDDGLVFVRGQLDGTEVSSLAGQPAHCITAMCEGLDGALLITQGSLQTKYENWATDLLNGGKTGRFITYYPESDQAKIVADRVAYCYGVSSDGSRTLFCESWAHRVMVCREGQIESGLSELPGYPSRISRAADGGFWLTLFAPRSQLLEFVLRERDYRVEMMQTVNPKYWIAPALSSGKDFLEPLQQGGVRQMGVLKPWAPARSYGLILRLSSDLVPLYSMHSRVGGLNHGIVSALELNGSLLALSKGSERILRVPLADQSLQG